MTNPQKTTLNKFSGQNTNLDYPVHIAHVNTATETKLKDNFHWHDEIEILRVNSGTLLVTVENNHSFRLARGQAMAIMPKHIHNYTSADDSPCDFDLFLFHPTFLFGYDKALLNAKYLAPLLASPEKFYYSIDFSENWHYSAFNLINELITINDEKKYGYELKTKGVLCELWVLFLSQVSMAYRIVPKSQPVLPNSRVRNAILYIEDHYAEAVTLEEIADSIHVSKSECCRSFKRSLNMTPFEYLMKYRIYTAASKIAANDPIANSISALAASIGFNNTSYFNKVFKEFLNCTPTQYRKDISSYDITELLPLSSHEE